MGTVLAHPVNRRRRHAVWNSNRRIGMKTSFVIATFIVVGAGSVGAGAFATFATQPYQGSDTLFDLTNAAVPGSQLGNAGDYQGGGSGAGENNMVAGTPKQATAPMSRMLGT